MVRRIGIGSDLSLLKQKVLHDPHPHPRIPRPHRPRPVRRDAAGVGGGVGRLTMTLDDLAEDRSLKRQVFESLGARNTYGLTIKEQTALDIEYEHAKRAWEKANAAYLQACADACSQRTC